MNLIRLLLLLALLWFVWRLLTTRRRAASVGKAESKAESYERMLQCQRCGTHLPASALSTDGRCGRCRE